MEADLLSYLRADAAVADAIGGRAYWVHRPQGGVLPAIVLTRIGRLPDYTMGGPSGLTESRIQVDCYAETYAKSKAVVRAVVARLSGARVKQGSTTFHGIFIDGERDTFEQADGGQSLYRCSTDLLLWHN